jgi:hypothetical protein
VKGEGLRPSLGLEQGREGRRPRLCSQMGLCEEAAKTQTEVVIMRLGLVA